MEWVKDDGELRWAINLLNQLLTGVRRTVNARVGRALYATQFLVIRILKIVIMSETVGCL